MPKKTKSIKGLKQKQKQHQKVDVKVNCCGHHKKKARTTNRGKSSKNSSKTESKTPATININFNTPPQEDPFIRINGTNHKLGEREAIGNILGGRVNIHNNGHLIPPNPVQANAIATPPRPILPNIPDNRITAIYGSVYNNQTPDSDNKTNEPVNITRTLARPRRQSTVKFSTNRLVQPHETPFENTQQLKEENTNLNDVVKKLNQSEEKIAEMMGRYIKVRKHAHKTDLKKKFEAQKNTEERLSTRKYYKKVKELPTFDATMEHLGKTNRMTTRSISKGADSTSILGSGGGGKFSTTSRW
jgi:hypothetical protein